MLRQGQNMRVIRWIGTSLKYVLGVLCWVAVFAYLQIQCLFNVGSFVDGLWMKELHDGLVENVIGEVAYRAGDGYGDYGCGAKYIYSVQYRQGRIDGEGVIRSLSSLVDVATWRMIGSESITATFLDAKHKYVLRSISDGVDISAGDR
jgi:hypothetical protein